jgi:hypothetical protein
MDHLKIKGKKGDNKNKKSSDRDLEAGLAGGSSSPSFDAAKDGTPGSGRPPEYTTNSFLKKLRDAASAVLTKKDQPQPSSSTNVDRKRYKMEREA